MANAVGDDDEGEDRLRPVDDTAAAVAAAAGVGCVECVLLRSWRRERTNEQR